MTYSSSKWLLVKCDSKAEQGFIILNLTVVSLAYPALECHLNFAWQCPCPCPLPVYISSNSWVFLTWIMVFLSYHLQASHYMLTSEQPISAAVFMWQLNCLGVLTKLFNNLEDHTDQTRQGAISWMLQYPSSGLVTSTNSFVIREYKPATFSSHGQQLEANCFPI